MPYVRRSARVLLLDGTGRILLLRFHFHDDPSRHGWVTPGGGVHDGESVLDAAVRELREEIGLVVTPEQLGRPVAVSSGYADIPTLATGVYRDDYFRHRVEAHDIDNSGMEEWERTHHGGHRWWSRDELATTTETVYPPTLASLLDELAAGGPRHGPLRLPWHH